MIDWLIFLIAACVVRLVMVVVDPFRSAPEGGMAGTRVGQGRQESPIQLMHSNVKLRARVEHLESHTKQLEDYISQLKSIAQMVCPVKLTMLHVHRYDCFHSI